MKLIVGSWRLVWTILFCFSFFLLHESTKGSQQTLLLALLLELGLESWRLNNQQHSMVSFLGTSFIFMCNLHVCFSFAFILLSLIIVLTRQLFQDEQWRRRWKSKSEEKRAKRERKKEEERRRLESMKLSLSSLSSSTSSSSSSYSSRKHEPYHIHPQLGKP